MLCDDIYSAQELDVPAGVPDAGPITLLLT